MAIFNEERAPSRPFGCWEFASMVEAGGSCERAVWQAGCARRRPSPDGDRRPSYHDTPRANRKRIIFVVKAFQAGCDRPITWALLCLSLRSPRRNTEPDRRSEVLQPCLPLKLTPPVALPQAYHRSTPQCCSDIGETHHNPNASYSNAAAEGKGGLKRDDEGRRSSPSEKTWVGCRVF
jgi:hypothetical protein